MKSIYLLILIIFCSVTSCFNNTASEEAADNKLKPAEIKNPVQVFVVKESTFHKELLSNGKLKARRKSNLRFQISGSLEEIRIRNGDQLSEGSVIAKLSQDEIKRSLYQKQLQLDRAELELRDILLGQRYLLEDSIRIPEYVFHIAKLRSGYSEALNELQNTQLDLQNTLLKAPFQGIVANLKHQQYEQISPSDEFCTLIDNSGFEVEFSVLETEITEIRPNKAVKVSPFANETLIFTGRITEINPLVDENGHITVKALVENTNDLIEGMNVKVKIESDVPGQLVVPKSAIVIRQDQEVLFKYTKGTAYWTYVQTRLENSTSFAVVAHPDKGASLVAGDTVIVGGNLNLAHGSEVVIGE